MRDQGIECPNCGGKEVNVAEHPVDQRKRYDGDYHNLNCEDCGRPAPRQPETLASMASKQKEAT